MSQMPKNTDQTPSALRVVGHSVTRVDAHAKDHRRSRIFRATGCLPRICLHGKTLRSPHAHARDRRIDTAKAEALPGVRAVITYRDVPANPVRSR